MSGSIFATVPVLPAQDIAATASFYALLGFANVGTHVDPEYLIVRRDGCEIHFWRCGDRHIAEASGCYVRSTDVDLLHAELAGGLARRRANGAAGDAAMGDAGVSRLGPQWEPFEVRPAGVKAVFFFEKKNQKTFIRLCRANG